MNSTATKPNRYAAICALGCGHRVAAEAGALVRTATGWGAQHLAGECPAAAPVAAPVAAAAPVACPDGFYAVEARNGVLCFYKITTSKGGRWDGMQWANRYKSDDEIRVGRAEREHVLAAVAADPAAAGKRFAEEFTRCFRCGRMLTDEVSRGRGLGPECATKV